MTHGISPARSAYLNRKWFEPSLGQLDDPDADVPMYSFYAPSSQVWQAIAQNLTDRGWPEKKVTEWLQSKQARWAMDGELGESLCDAANEYANKFIR